MKKIVKFVGNSLNVVRFFEFIMEVLISVLVVVLVLGFNNPWFIQFLSRVLFIFCTVEVLLICYFRLIKIATVNHYSLGKMEKYVDSIGFEGITVDSLFTIINKKTYFGFSPTLLNLISARIFGVLIPLVGLLLLKDFYSYDQVGIVFYSILLWGGYLGLKVAIIPTSD